MAVGAEISGDTFSLLLCFNVEGIKKSDVSVISVAFPRVKIMYAT